MRSINTPSMLAVEDALDGLRWAEAIGGLPALIGRAEANLAAHRGLGGGDTLGRLPRRGSRDALAHVGVPEDRRSRLPGVPRTTAGGSAKRIAGLLEQEGAGYDVGAYRDAPPGLRLWAGARRDRRSASAVSVARLGLGQRRGRTAGQLALNPHPRPPPGEGAAAGGRGGGGRGRERVRGERVRPALTFFKRNDTMPKVLISDSMSPQAADILREPWDRRRRQDRPEAGRAEGDIGGYDGLAVRSATKVTADILSAANGLKVIGRAGIGVDNVDLAAATARGIVVMNTPFGNSITTAEHALAMMMALARQIPQANASTHAGKWEKSRFMGVELAGKTLGIVGCGNIGGIVADRARGLKMKVLAHDPYLSPERAEDLGVERSISTSSTRGPISSACTLRPPKQRAA